MLVKVAAEVTALVKIDVVVTVLVKVAAVVILHSVSVTFSIGEELWTSEGVHQRLISCLKSLTRNATFVDQNVYWIFDIGVNVK